jgi:hypothetical protein
MQTITTSRSIANHASSSTAPFITTDALPWVPLGPGKSFKPLRFLRENRGWVHLLQLDPGVAIARHRHTGEVHALNLRGARKLGTGEVIGAGDYVYEPPGNIDTWAAIGDEPVVIHITIFGAVEYLEDDGRVRLRLDASTQYELYRKHCEANGIAVVDLFV